MCHAMQAIAPLVPHYLMGIAAGSGILGLFMIVCGFFQPLNSMPKARSTVAGSLQATLSQ